MADRIRFHLDEHVDPAIAAGLRAHGINVTTTIEARLRAADDLQHFEFARAENRVVVTHDADFLRLADTVVHRGIAYCAASSRSIGQIIRSLILVWEVLTPDEMAGQVEYL